MILMGLKHGNVKITTWAKHRNDASLGVQNENCVMMICSGLHSTKKLCDHRLLKSQKSHSQKVCESLFGPLQTCLKTQVGTWPYN